MKQFKSVSTLVSYQGNDSEKRLRKFIKFIERNMNNSTNIESNLDINRGSKGYVIRLLSVNGIKKVFPSGGPREDRKYSIRYFINMFNSQNLHFYGNTFRSQKLDVGFVESGHIKIKDPYPLQAYVLSPNEASDQCIVQIIFVESNKDDIILSQTCEGWTIFSLKNFVVGDKSVIANQEIPQGQTKIFLGNPRDLLFKEVNKLTVLEGATLDYESILYPNLEKIKFLLPDYVTLGGTEQLPGLMFRYLPANSNEFDINQEIKTLAFDDVYLKNVEITLGGNIEEKLLQFANKYREDKYGIFDNQFNKIFIKERRLKCGIHNTWCFINSNGLENAMTLSKKDNKLINKGVLLIDNFFSDELSSCALIIELNYTITVPIAENQKEENLNLPIGYSVFVPNIVTMENKSHNAYLLTGPGETVYGDHLWDPLELSDRMITINFILSKSKEPVETEQIDQKKKENIENLENMKKSLVESYNIALLNKDKASEDERKLYEQKIRELEQKLEEEKKSVPYSSQQVIPQSQVFPEQPIVQQPIIAQTQPEIVPRIEETKNAQLSITQESNLLTQPKIIPPNIIYNPQPTVNILRDSRLSQEEYDEFKQFQDFKKKSKLYASYETMDKLMEDTQLKSKIIYDERVKDISKKEKADYLARGIFSLNLEEKNQALIQFTLQKELQGEYLGHLITFQFLAYKPRKDIKTFDAVPKKLQFYFSFWTFDTVNSPVCTVTRPESEVKFINNPLTLVKEGSLITSEDNEKEVSVQFKYDPSIETHTDLRDFITYLVSRQMVIEVFDPEKNFVLGYIKVSLKDLIRQGKPQTYQTKEYEIYSDNFELNGYIQMLLKSVEMNTSKPYKYNPNALKVINSKDGYNHLSKKKKVRVKQIDLSKIPNEDKVKLGDVMLQKEKNDINQNVLNESINSQNKYKMNIDPAIEQKIRTMRYLNNNNDLVSSAVLKQEEANNNIHKIKNQDNEKFLKSLAFVEKYREYKRPDIISKVTQENHKNEISLSLIMGQPHLFNYIVTNDSTIEELYHIVISSSNERDQEIPADQSDKTVSIINTPEEWAKVVELNNLATPNDYNSISQDNYFVAKPNESVPLAIKLLTYQKLKENTTYSIWIHKKNGQPIYFLSITITNVFPVIDHVFKYYLPCNKAQNVGMVNPFKNSRARMQKVLDNYVTTDSSISLILDSKTYDFSFQFTTKEEGFVHEFLLFIYLEKTKSDLYLTWKFEIYSMNIIELRTHLGSKSTQLLRIENNRGNNNDAKSLKLYSNEPTVLFFVEGQDEFTLLPSQAAESKYIIHPKNNIQNTVMINCVNTANRDLYQNWLVKITSQKPDIDETVKVECIIGSITNIKYEFTNPLNKWVLLNIDTGNSEFLNVVDSKAAFDANETKFINISIPSQEAVGRAEVLVFIYDQDEVFSRTVLFQMNYK